MRRSRRFHLVLIGVVAFGAALCGEPHRALSDSAEGSFLGEIEDAMSRMMSAMTVQPTGDVDRDFVAMMAPHHQGAIDMAQIELRYGHNEQLRRLAQEIIVTQMDEIRVMRLSVSAQ